MRDILSNNLNKLMTEIDDNERGYIRMKKYAIRIGVVFMLLFETFLLLSVFYMIGGESYLETIIEGKTDGYNLIAQFFPPIVGYLCIHGELFDKNDYISWKAIRDSVQAAFLGWLCAIGIAVFGFFSSALHAALGISLFEVLLICIVCAILSPPVATVIIIIFKD